MDILKIFTAIFPVILSFILLVLFKFSAKKGMFITTLLFLPLVYFIWGMNLPMLFASSIQGIHKAITIVWILFGAMMLLKINTYNKNMNVIKNCFKSLSPDMRVQGVIVGFLFVSLIEGVAGFGTPAIVAAPIMIALGFPAIAAVSLALIGDSVAVSFGAVGVPVTVGLGNIPEANNDFFHTIARSIVHIDSLSMILLPTIILVVLVKGFNKNNISKLIIEFLPWTLFIGITYSITANVSANFLGPEFISIISAIITLFVAAISSKYNFLLKKEFNWRCEGSTEESKEITKVTKKEMMIAFSPYLLIIALLVITRINIGVKNFVLHHIDLSIHNILNRSLNDSWQVLYSPGTILFIAAMFAYIINFNKEQVFEKSIKDTFKSIKNTFLVLSFILIFVQIFVNSGHLGNGVNTVSMPHYLGNYLSSIFHSKWPLIAPSLGVLGAFITGSATVSTLTFSTIQYDVAKQAMIPSNIVLAEQVLGGAYGNMISILNVVAASSVIGMANREGEIIRKTIFPCLLVTILTSVIGFLII